jgi:hypothetical protein
MQWLATLRVPTPSYPPSEVMAAADTCLDLHRDPPYILATLAGTLLPRIGGPPGYPALLLSFRIERRRLGLWSGRRGRNRILRC